MSDMLQCIRQKFILLFIFGIAMGFLEGIVVVYLQQIYFPQGFEFPLPLLPPEMVRVEWIREISTLVMLGSVAWLAGKNLLQRLSFFLFTFGVWDIIYYVALKLFLGWPASLLTWDILFLIPVPWIGPVLAPVIISLTMIAMAIVFTVLSAGGTPVRLRSLHWILIFTGSAVLIYSFIREFLNLTISASKTFNLETEAGKEAFMQTVAGYVPEHYGWWLFVAGELVIVVAVLHAVISQSHHKPISHPPRSAGFGPP